MDYIAKVLHNKRNNQMYIALSRKKLKIAKGKKIKQIRMKKLELF